MLMKSLAGAIVASSLLSVLLGARADAQEQAGRYTMSPTEGGFVRLDRDTGAMSICTGKENDWSCKPMPDHQQELANRIDELERENKALLEERRQLQARGGANDEPPPDASASPEPPGDLPIPREEDVDKLFDYVEGMMKKFKERIKRLEREAKEKESSL